MSRRVKKQSFSTWLRPTKGEPTEDGAFKISVPNQFVADWVDSHFRDLVNEAFVEVLGRKYEVVYIITGHSDEDQTELELDSDSVQALAERGPRPSSNLNARYSFDSLVVGDFNQFACAASMAVAEAPGLTKYNPLYIYGRTGLGKTHIIQAIGSQILKLWPDKSVIYATSEKFTSDFIAAISDRSISDFTKLYRDVDALIIDDIQFFAGKEGTQEQFFHTFNVLYHAGKQIILSSDRPPRDISGLEDRLLSRFSWGLVTDLQAPDLENRTAILYKKLETEGTELPESVVRYIADKVTANIRELEGALIRVLAYASLKKVPADLEMARKVLSDTISHQKRQITIHSIQEKTASHFQIESGLMTAKKKTARVALARQVAMYLSRSLTNNSLKAIGSAFGGRDHTTVIHACSLISKRMSGDAVLRDAIDNISASLLY
ncbi:MAG: chromosomal replication initiator protein DnaA [Candidatus Zixiibacteriota bacterium]|nr:MAG: chromosomal replication initiator protein DnaA [candidate division Zixibacteria bacterium]